MFKWMTHRPKDFAVSKSGEWAQKKGEWWQWPLQGLTTGERTWPEESAPEAQQPVLKMDTPLYSTLEAVPLVRAPWAFWPELGIHRLANRENGYLEDSGVCPP